MKPDLTQEMKALGQTVLVLQGGGALGAYQVGVYEALAEAGIEPDWVVGTSIGAINAGLIAGSPKGERIERLREFWKRVEHGTGLTNFMPQWLAATARNAVAVSNGVPSFFQPQPAAFLSPHLPLGADAAGYYTTRPLMETLEELIDFDQLNSGDVRLTVGASKVSNSEMVYFDSRDMELDVHHIMASGALPPAFPAVRIDGELYWDGGILSNTPVEVVFDDNPRRSSLVFAVHIWNPHGPEPRSIWEVMNRQKDLQYSSRSMAQIKRQRQLHRLRHIIAELSAMVPADRTREKTVTEMRSYGCTTTMHVVRLLAPALEYEDHSKDIDFSPEGIRQRWEAGYRHTMDTIEQAPWRGKFDPLEGFILHETCGGEMVETAAGRA
nr:patatin-like phospholipase family protein [Sphingomonas sp.]